MGKIGLFHLYHDTDVLFGSLDFLRPLISMADARRAVLAGACGIYHTCCHNFLHERDWDTLLLLYKSAFFVLRAKHFCETGVYIRKRTVLTGRLPAEERKLLDPADGAAFDLL